MATARSKEISQHVDEQMQQATRRLQAPPGAVSAAVSYESGPGQELGQELKQALSGFGSRQQKRPTSRMPEWLGKRWQSSLWIIVTCMHTYSHTQF